jgi:hypothetical protein
VLLSGERRPDSVVFWFRADAGTREQVDDLARREHACCPFLDYHVETAGDQVIWTTTNAAAGEERVAVDVILDAFHALPEHTGSDFDGYVRHLADRGVHVLRAGDERFELR